MAALERSCRCGQVRLSVDVPTRRVGTRVMCYCKDCQTAARALGADDMLTPAGGTDIFQTTPDRLTIEAGADQLKILRLSPKGLFRWYAGCCDTPMVNTLARLGLPFVGVVIDDHDGAGAVIGPVFAEVATASAKPGAGAPRRDVNFNAAGWRVLTRMVTAALSGRGRTSPLRGADGGPIADVRVLSLEDRRAATP